MISPCEPAGRPSLTLRGCPARDSDFREQILMKHPLRVGIVVWLVCAASLFAQSNPSSTEAKQPPPAGSGIRVHIYTTSGDVQVPLGSSYLVTAAVEGPTTNTALKWMVAGDGCSGAACGTVTDGLYLTPTVMPKPPVVSVIAISEAEPKARAAIRIHLVAAAKHK